MEEIILPTVYTKDLSLKGVHKVKILCKQGKRDPSPSPEKILHIMIQINESYKAIPREPSADKIMLLSNIHFLKEILVGYF